MAEADSGFDMLFNNPYGGGFGCVLFDLQENERGELRPMPTKGWASAKGEKAVRITGPQDLSTDVKWICNLGKTEFWSQGLVRLQKLRHSGYFKTDMGFLMKEYGILPQKISVTESCERLSEIYDRAMSMGADHYRFSDLRGGELSEDIYLSAVGSDQSVSNEMDEALLRAYQDFSKCPLPQQRNPAALDVVLRLPRVSHAKNVCGAKIPAGRWRLVTMEGMDPDARLAWALENHSPFVAKVAIRGLRDKIPGWVSGIVEPGEVMGEGGRKKDRDWMTCVELRAVSKFAKVDVKAAFEGEGWGLCSDGPSILELGPLSDMSISLGLLAEAHAMGLSGRSRHPVTGSKTLITPRACWMKAVDKAICMTKAIQLANEGFPPVSYGNGAVVIKAEPPAFSKLRSCAAKFGLTVPMTI